MIPHGSPYTVGEVDGGWAGGEEMGEVVRDNWDLKK